MKKLIPVLFFFGLIACGEENDVSEYGNLTIGIRHLVNGSSAMYDEMIYENEAGNPYEITNIQWFLSDLVFVRDNGEEIQIGGNDWIHYVDTDLPGTWTWPLEQEFAPGNYSAVRFVFGIRGEKNQPNRFTDPPKSNMFWPYPMGGEAGGYHYMKLNGFWNDPEAERIPFNFHLGVGQIYDGEGNVTEFIQNWFESEIQVNFSILPGQKTRISLDMNIENWFKGPFTYDHNEYGSRIMNNQEAMYRIRENGIDVFSISVQTDEEIE
jgi:hypothetical protein